MSKRPLDTLPFSSRRGPGIWVWIVLVIFVIGAFLFTWQFVEPPPPREIVIATGESSGRYKALGQQLQSALREGDLRVVLRETAGSVDNLELLTDPSSGVALALVQSGLARETEHPTLRALGSLFYEPLWVFVRKDAGIESFTDLGGKRIAVGGPGSGSVPVAESLFNAAGISSNVSRLHVGGAEAKEALLSGKVDAAVFVMSIEAPLVRDLFTTESLIPLSFPNAGAYGVRFRYLSAVTVGHGVVDIGGNHPTEDLPLLACHAMLVARSDLHPAIAPLILSALREVLSEGGMLEQPGEFPSRLGLSLPLADEAGHFFNSGPPFLQRYLPFRFASMLDRLKILLVPILTLLFPIVRLAGPTWRWRARRKVLKWYRVLRDLDQGIALGKVTDPAAAIQTLETVRQEIRRLRVPLFFTDTLFHLQAHVDLVLSRLQTERGGQVAPGGQLLDARSSVLGDPSSPP